MKIEPFALERWLSKHELHVRYDIAESGILPLTLNDLLAFEPRDQASATLNQLLGLPLGYGEGPGSVELRTLLAETYEGCMPDNILVTTGAIEANFLLFNVLLSTGDHVVAPYPAYQQLYSVPRAIGCDVSLWQVGPETGFEYDVAALEKLVTPKTRLIVVNTPHNPTGAMLSPAEAERVYALAESVGAWVMCDEAYRWLRVPGGDPFAPPMFNLGPRGISVGTLSKPFGLPGVRIGWLAAAPELAAQCWAMRDYVTITAGKLDDKVARLALRHRHLIFARNDEIIAANLVTAQEWIEEHADILSWKPPRGGLLALIHYDLDIPSLELADRLATEHSVMLAPGSAFGYERYLRIGIGQHPEVFRAGLNAASAGLAAARS
jgi:aspartate/methionine/tyrosine aminotransferase